jgi:hypothetical protein
MYGYVQTIPSDLLRKKYFLVTKCPALSKKMLKLKIFFNADILPSGRFSSFFNSYFVGTILSLK